MHSALLEQRASSISRRARSCRGDARAPRTVPSSPLLGAAGTIRAAPASVGVERGAPAGRIETEEEMKNQITTKLLALCLAGATLSPTYAAAGPGFAYGHDDTSYPDDGAVGAATPAPAPAVARGAAPAPMLATVDVTAYGTGSGGPQEAAAVRLVCHPAAADAKELP
jgi:hypothetical protein